jgi:hypothetical protein
MCRAPALKIALSIGITRTWSMPASHPYLSKDMAWVLRWHSIQTNYEPLMDAPDRALFEKYYKPFVRHDRTFIFHPLPKKRLTDYLPLVKEFFPEKVVF